MSSDFDSNVLYQACRSTDTQERTDAYQQLGEFLLRVAHSRLRSKPDLHPRAQECVQEALVTVWQKLEASDGPDDPERFLSWSASIVIYKVYDMLRRLGYPTSSGSPEDSDAAEEAIRRKKRVPKERQESLEQFISYDDGTGVPRGERLPDPETVNPEDHIVDQDSLIELLLGIRDHERLSDDSKEVLMRGFLAGDTDDELAGRLDTSKSNVYVIRSRDLSKLREDDEFMTQLQTYYS